MDFEQWKILGKIRGNKNELLFGVSFANLPNLQRNPTYRLFQKRKYGFLERSIISKPWIWYLYNLSYQIIISYHCIIPHSSQLLTSTIVYLYKKNKRNTNEALIFKDVIIVSIAARNYKYLKFFDIYVNCLNSFPHVCLFYVQTVELHRRLIYCKISQFIILWKRV